METVSAHTPISAPSGPKTPKFVRWAVMLGIIVSLNIFFFVLNSLIFTAPKYEDFCKMNGPSPMTTESCAAEGGTWTSAPPAPTTDQPGLILQKTPSGYCDLYTKCQKPFNDAQQKHQLETFILFVGLGVLSIIVGVLPLGSSIVSSGLSYGGVLAFIIGAAQYWSEAGSWLRLAISLIALAALIYIGLKRFRD
jgi:hypothetical protein